jgi:hypothetical protein
MKNFSLTVLFLLSCFFSFSQEAKSFEKIILVDSINKASIFISINEWFAKTYNSANDVIQINDKEEGIIIGNGIIIYNYGKVSYSCSEGSLKYSIKVSVKNNKYKIELSNFIHTVNIGNNLKCQLGLINNSDLYSTSGMYKGIQNDVWNDIKLKIEQFSNSIFQSIESHTQKINTEKNKNDW